MILSLHDPFLPLSTPSSLHIKFWFHCAKLLELNAPNIRDLTHEDGNMMMMPDYNASLFLKFLKFSWVHHHLHCCSHWKSTNWYDDSVRIKKMLHAPLFWCHCPWFLWMCKVSIDCEKEVKRNNTWCSTTFNGYSCSLIYSNLYMSGCNINA